MDEPQATTVRMTRLSGVGQLYVTTVGAVAVLTMIADAYAWYVALVVLALPLSLLALWVGFYAAMAVGFFAGQGLDEPSWPVAIAWVAVWTVTAWLNAQIAQKVRRAGWRAMPARRFEDDDLEDH